MSQLTEVAMRTVVSGAGQRSDDGYYHPDSKFDDGRYYPNLIFNDGKHHVGTTREA
ncbi:hypothetical protein BDR03DRAFT_1018299 [Suillus americanus]|nr:hypothetical protein BDR03DRAFT_1018299 [Suillus americanus]